MREFTVCPLILLPWSVKNHGPPWCEKLKQRWPEKIELVIIHACQVNLGGLGTGAAGMNLLTAANQNSAFSNLSSFTAAQAAAAQAQAVVAQGSGGRLFSRDRVSKLWVNSESDVCLWNDEFGTTIWAIRNFQRVIWKLKIESSNQGRRQKIS